MAGLLIFAPVHAGAVGAGSADLGTLGTPDAHCACRCMRPALAADRGSARTALEHQPQVLLRDTHIWQSAVLVQTSPVPPPGLDSPSVVEFPSPSGAARYYTGWHFSSIRSVEADPYQRDCFDSQAGFGLRLQDLAPGVRVLCQAQLIGPGPACVAAIGTSARCGPPPARSSAMQTCSKAASCCWRCSSSSPP